MLVQRDPFARTEIHRSLVEVGTLSRCCWCGQPRYYGGKVTSKLFRYYTELDNGHVYYHNGLFCSKGCHDAYHN